jgi:hypothetical protein
MNQAGNSRDGEAAAWHDMVAHLTTAHGTNPGAIESYAPTLGQLKCEHWTAHLTGDATGLIFRHSHHPHSHPEPVSEGERFRTAGSYAPFPPSPAWQAADPWAGQSSAILGDSQAEAGQ